MKTQIRFVICFLAVIAAFAITSSCKKKEPPVVTTTEISGITQTTATGGGEVTDDGGADVTERGICWSAGGDPTIDGNKTVDGSGTGGFTSSLSGLNLNTAYNVRAYATNKAGTGYGEMVVFYTLYPAIAFNPALSYGSVTDYDGNVYRTITIGTQTWMAENLKVTHYRNGDAIPNVVSGSTWENLSTGAMTDYDNRPTTSMIFGKLYNFYAVSDSRKIAPAGWHVPSEAEWTTMVNFLGGFDVAGDKLKEVGNSHWFSNNGGADNLSGFTAIPGGTRDWLAYSIMLGEMGFWWCSTAYDSNTAIFWSLHDYEPDVYSDMLDKTYGYSVRCVKD